MDYLNPGSCFHVYSAFDHDSESMLDFTAVTTCCVDVIDAADLRALGKSYIQLSDIFAAFDIELNSKQKTDLDFFRNKTERS